MRPGHRLASRSHLEAEDFADENLIVYYSLEETLVFRKMLQPAGIRPKQVLQMQLTEAILEMVKAGLGVSVLARWAVREQIESGALRAVPLTANGCRRQWSAAMLKDKIAPPYLLEFADLLAKNSVPVTASQKKASAIR